jgi:hypothetical protein
MFFVLKLNPYFFNRRRFCDHFYFAQFILRLLEIYILHIINDLEFLKISANSLFVVAFCCSKATWEVKVAH